MIANGVHPTYRADIDGLRALAVLSVLCFHAFPTVMPAGFMGVDIFFVISGYLISSIIFNGLKNNDFSFTDFYTRRIRRIFPALLLVLASCFVVGWFVLLPDELKQLGKHIAAGAGFGSNFALLSENGYFDNLSDTKPLLHLWSLGIEEQFYVIWPFVLFLTWRLRKTYFPVIVIIFAISFLLNVGRIHQHAVSVFYEPQTRFWELLIGAGLSYVTLYGTASLSQLHSSSLTRQNLLSLCGFALLAIACFSLTKDKRFPGWWALLPTLGGALLIAGGSQAWVNRVFLSNRLMVWIGLISYPLYLWHWPLLSFARIMQSETPSVEIRIAALAFSFLLAWLTYKLIEKPIRYSKKLASNAIAVVLIFLMLLMGLAGFNAYARDGYGFRKSIKDLALQNSGFNWDDLKKYAPATVNDPPYFKRDVMLIGDSHAQAIFGGLSELFKQYQTRLQLRAGAACPPFYDLTVQHIGHQEECKDVMNSYLDAVIKDVSIKTVILTSRGPLYLTGHGFGDGDAIHLMIKSKYANAKPNEDYTDVFADAMSRTLMMLTKADKKVIFIVDAPELGFAPELCVDARPYKIIDNKKIVCGIPKDIYLKRNAAYLNIVDQQAVAFPNVKFLHTSKHLCDDHFCYAKKDGIIFYRDDDHLSYEGSLKMGRLFENDFFYQTR